VLSVREYLTRDGRNPFREWLGALDVAVRARVQARMLRSEMGNLGDHKSVGGGIWEARLAFGPGYRIYFGKDGDLIIVLLLAVLARIDCVRNGHKSITQQLELLQCVH